MISNYNQRNLDSSGKLDVYDFNSRDNIKLGSYSNKIAKMNSLIMNDNIGFERKLSSNNNHVCNSILLCEDSMSIMKL